MIKKYFIPAMPVNTVPQELMTVDDLATYLKLSKSSIYKLIHKREIPHFKPTNGKVWFRLNEINTWLTAGQVNDIQTIQSNLILKK